MLSGGRVCHAEVLGHEGVGAVLSAPSDSPLAKGTRVIVNPVHHSKPECVIGHSRDGVFRELFWLDSSEMMQGGFLVACPTGCPADSATLALAEPLASVLYSLELLRQKENATSLLVRGSGTIAILAARLWSSHPNSKAVLVSKSEAHAQWLRKSIPWPANVEIWSLETTADPRRNNKNAGFSAAILCCSREDAPQGLQFLMDSVEDGATIDLMAGFPADYKEPRLATIELDRIRWDNICGVQSAPPTIVLDQKTQKTLSLVGHRGTSERQILDAVNLLSQKAISLADVPHKKVSLEELPTTAREILSPARQKMRWSKAIVTFPQESLGDLDG
jgi:threonine dehydrogenase-like Zn-dependent dehydrogenase